MIRSKVQSSTIDSIGYDRGSETLEVEFLNGSIYQYTNVPIDEYWRFMKAESKGSYLAKEIKGNYEFKKIK